MSNTWDKWGVLLKDAGEDVLYWFDTAFDEAWNASEWAGNVYGYNRCIRERNYWNEYNEFLDMPLCEVHNVFSGYRDFDNACYEFVDGE